MMVRQNGDTQDFLNLSLSTTPSENAGAEPSRRRRPERRSCSRPFKAGDIPAPYPWATSKRATLHNLQDISSKGISTVTGSVQCKKCDQKFEMEYDLHKTFKEVAMFIVRNMEEMRHRAADVWCNPTLPDCGFCGQAKCVKPVMGKKKEINWLFLFLGQMVGCCKLSELKYFCKYTRKHRTGAKDRVLFLTYLEIFRQLQPQGYSEQ